MEHSKTYIAVPPGETIREMLDDRNISQNEFAVRMGMSAKHISRLINGKVELTPDTALKLEYVLGMPASFWLNFEALYRADLAKVRQENKLESEENFVKKISYSAFVSAGWVEKAATLWDKIVNLRKLFEVSDLNYVFSEEFKKVAFRKLKNTEKSELMALAWCHKARAEARSQELNKLNTERLKKRLNELKTLTNNSSPDLGAIRSLLNDCGIAFIILPSLNGSGIHGASFANGKNVVLGLTDRGKTTDIFAFSLFHEIGHILKGDFWRCGELTSKDEDQADEFARDALITPAVYADFVNKADYSKAAIVRLSEQENIDSGVVVGRLQKEGLVAYNKLNELKHNVQLSIG